MYLSRAGRLAAAFCAVLFLLWLGASIAVPASGRHKSEDIAALVAMFLFIGLPTGIPTVMLLRYLFSDAKRLVEQHDVFRGTLGLPQVAEKRGVQWALLAFPDLVRAPSVAVVAVLLQNCHAKPRRVSITLNPGGRPELQASGAVVLKGGEAGILRFPLSLASGFPAQPLLVSVTLDVLIPEGCGHRVIRADGASRRSAPHYRGVTIDVAAAHGGPTRNEAARTWTGWKPLFITGMRTPDLEPLRLLESLSEPPPS